MHMDESKPSIPPGKFRSASDWISADIDPPPAALAKSDELIADGRSVAVYCRNEEEVSQGFLIALRAMGIAIVEQLPEPAKLPAARAKP
jgi:hypothetical protein